MNHRTVRSVVVAVAMGLHTASRPALAGGDRALGEFLSAECVTCHQRTGKYEGIPPIVGWPEAAFVQVMNEYRTKARNNQIMQTIAARFSNEEIAALAAYFASLKAK